MTACEQWLEKGEALNFFDLQADRVFFLASLMQDAWIMCALPAHYYSAMQSTATCLHTHRGIFQGSLGFASLP